MAVSDKATLLNPVPILNSMKKELIILGADHNGFKLKEHLKSFLVKKGFQVLDKGNKKLVKTDDYPKYGLLVAKEISKRTNAKGILLCGSSQGVCIVANKLKGVRAVSAETVAEAKKTREHNDANVLCLSGWRLTKDKAQKLVTAWLNASFSKAPRHRRRVKEIQSIERQHLK